MNCGVGLMTVSKEVDLEDVSWISSGSEEGSWREWWPWLTYILGGWVISVNSDKNSRFREVGVGGRFLIFCGRLGPHSLLEKGGLCFFCGEMFENVWGSWLLDTRVLFGCDPICTMPVPGRSFLPLCPGLVCGRGEVVFHGKHRWGGVLIDGRRCHCE